MKNVLEAKGWVMYYQCDCPGGRKRFYKNDQKPKYEVREKIKSKTFSILMNNMIIAGPFWEYQLEEKLTEHVN